MTNISSLIISLVLSTNWSGHFYQQQELGYVVTNHVAEVRYQGTTNRFTLKSDASNTALWRDQPVIQNQSLTNFYWYVPRHDQDGTIYLTNRSLLFQNAE